MDPWGHAAVSYLTLSLGVRLLQSRAGSLSGGRVLLVVFGSQVPDLIDKPLGWTLGIVEYGASIGHSALTFALVALSLVWLTQRRPHHRRLGGAFLLGYATHILADVADFAYAGAFGALRFLVWPLLSPPSSPKDRSIIAALLTQDLSDPFVVLQFVLVVIAIAVWIDDGRPGWEAMTTRSLP